MKKNSFYKISVRSIIAILIVAMLSTSFIPIVTFANNTAQPEETTSGGTFGVTANGTADDGSSKDQTAGSAGHGVTNDLTSTQAQQALLKLQKVRLQKLHQQKIAQENQLIEKEVLAWAKKQETSRKSATTKENFEKAEKILSAINESVPEIAELFRDGFDGGDFDHEALANTALDLASGILACFVPWGTVASIGIKLAQSIAKEIMGGKDGPTAEALMEDRLTQRIDQVADQVCQVQDQLADLSNQVAASVEQIIDAIPTALENETDKNRMIDFMLSSGTTDFSYNQLRNYIYGSLEENRNADTAYYAHIQDAQLNGGSSEEIKYYYDKLYSSLMAERKGFHDYVIGDQFGKSIVATYYDLISTRPDLVAATGMSPMVAAIDFAYELYTTEILIDEILLSCNNYQLTYMQLNNVTSYDYGTGKIYLTDILNEDGSSNRDIPEMLIQSIDDLRIQFAKDLVSILNPTGMYIVEENGQYICRETRTADAAIYADVTVGQTVYFNHIPSSACERFDLDPAAFAYSGRGVVDPEGIVRVTEENQSTTFPLTYKDKDGSIYTLAAITFADPENSLFPVGNGTAEEPYLIANAAQFMEIGNGMDKHYRLTGDIDLGGMKLYPFGYSVNAVGSEVYEEFTGSLDGNGYTLSNFSIQPVRNSGLFGIIGHNGLVENLVLENASSRLNNTKTNGSATTYTGGILAGINHGYIYSCKVSLCSVSVTSNTTNEGAERHVFFQYGGMVGSNKGTIYAAWVEKTVVDVISTHNFGGGSVDKNHNNVFVGGICGICPGELHYAGAGEKNSVHATTTSVLSPKEKSEPYLKAIAGGITTNESLNINNISNIYSAAKVADVTAYVDIDIVDSGRAERYDNATDEPNVLIPFLSETTTKALVTTPEDISAKFYKAPVYEVTITDSTEAYPVDATDLDFSKLEVTVNSQKINLTRDDTLFMYGFATYNESYEEQLKNAEEVTLFFLTEIEGETVLLSGSFLISVDKNFAKDISVYQYDTYYLKGEAVATEASLVVTDANGKTSTVIGAAVTVTDAAAATAALGKKEIELNYEGAKCKVEIEVLCNIHYSFFDFDNPDHYTFKGTVAPTCQSEGYDEYSCNTCGYTVQRNFTAKNDHTVIREVSREATCTETGIVGKIYCSSCGTVFQEQAVIPQLQHVVVNTGDADNHTCKNCNKDYAHEYVVSESIVNGQVTYTYTCSACGYVGVKNDTNIITFEERLRPAVVVSNGYALKGGDLVTVYVDLENNPGVNGANFGIRYTEGLELVGWYEGTFFQDTLGASNAVSCGYNFSWGSEAVRNAESGNLLRLVFRVPFDAKIDDEYTVSVVYSTVANSEGGFSLPANICAQLQISSSIPQKFITKDGVIRVVDRLPGDVNNDTFVNLLDALYLSNCLVNETDYPITDEVLEFGDVNLVGGININDVTKLLQSIAGGYGASILSPNYQIMLNTNGYDYDPGILSAQLYGEHNTYAALEQIEAFMQQREGYKFLGWYTRLEGGRKIADYNSAVKFDEDQKIQTLYAHWEKNTVSFDMNGATSSQLTTESYTGNGAQFITLTAPKEEYEITFVDPANPDNNIKKTMSHAFAYWLGSDGVKYYAGDSFPVHRANMGAFTLKAVWGEWNLEIPALNKPGYDASQITWYTKNTNGLLDNPLGENPCETIKAMEAKILYGKWTKPITYQVIYNGNGATSGSVPATTHFYGTTAELSGNTDPGFKRAPTVTLDYNWGNQVEKLQISCIFKGWQTKDGASLNGKLDVSLQPTSISNNQVTVFAAWEGEAITLPQPLERPGYRFDGWYTEDGKLKGYGGAERIFAEDTTLYAKWIGYNYTIQYDANKPANATFSVTNMPNNTPAQNGVDVTLPAQSPTLTGWTFKGWYNGTKFIGNAGETVTSPDLAPTGTVTLYARWEPNKIKVNYDANGGSVSPATEHTTKYFDSPYGSLPNPTPPRSDYAFVGWMHDSVYVTANTVVTTASEHTLVAVWTPISASITRSGRTITIGENQTYREIFYPEFDAEALLRAGYTKIVVRIRFDANVVTDCYQQITAINPRNGKTLYSRTWDIRVEYGSGWRTQLPIDFTMYTSDLRSNCSFQMSWHCPDSYWGDEWQLGSTYVTITAVKG